MTNQQAKTIIAALAYAIYHNDFPTTVSSDSTYTLSNADNQNLDNPNFYFNISSLGTVNVENMGSSYQVKFNGEYIKIEGSRGDIKSAQYSRGNLECYDFNVSQGEVSFSTNDGREVIRVQG